MDKEYFDKLADYFRQQGIKQESVPHNAKIPKDVDFVCIGKPLPEKIVIK